MVLTIDANLNRSQTVAHHIDEVLAYQRGSQTEFPLTDALGSLYASTDASGAVVHRYDFDAYGKRTDLGGSAPAVDVGYTGRTHDDNGLMQYRPRYFSPRTGNFLSPDRAGMIDGPNLYGYVRNMPTMATDPSGESTLLVNTDGLYFGGYLSQIVQAQMYQFELNFISQEFEGGDFDVGFASSLSPSHTYRLSQYISKFLDPVTVSFVSTCPRSGGPYFRVDKITPWDIEIYPGNFGRFANNETFLPGLMLYAWVQASMVDSQRTVSGMPYPAFVPGSGRSPMHTVDAVPMAVADRFFPGWDR